ncbi:hypothetical protein [Merismopedia glauca]|uniref:Uncharacterized protein n=1 Tax=Merismopedia glauca CCAP 1448/3 TaxID=1296344 RepID=A0A2T1BY60_9CYAN|nr:hypothetical protein [Merismopedia glauca]PSB00941.1 hypothetical protein C7B64_20855 [Merismopedia glauca CCAP 1448/3]
MEKWKNLPVNKKREYILIVIASVFVLTYGAMFLERSQRESEVGNWKEDFCQRLWDSAKIEGSCNQGQPVVEVIAL